jgi:acyl-CoA thioesterase I
MIIGAAFQRFLPQNARRYLAFALLCIVVTACGKSPTLPPIEANATVLAFGDSLTFGTGATPAESYPAQLAALISRNVVAAGVPGEVSADGLARLPAALEEHRPKLLLLCHGGNDFLRKLGEDVAAANVRAMVKLALDKNIAVAIIATPKPGFSVAPPAFYAEIAKEFGVPINDSALKKILTDNALKSDLVHPNAKGYRQLAEDIAAMLRKAGAV